MITDFRLEQIAEELTMDLDFETLKSIAEIGFSEEELKHILETEYSEANVSPGVFEQVCEENGWEFNIDSDYNGWEVDWWGDVTINDVIVDIYGCMYYGTAKLTLGQDE